MIAFIRGEVVMSEPGSVVVDVGGIGYHVRVPLSSSTQLLLPGGTIKLFTRLIIREDEMQLYGFSTAEELSVFSLLLNVNGVGPKVAISVLSAFTPEILRTAVAEENVALLSKANGIGKKTAQRIILELKDRLGPVIPGVTQREEQVSGPGEEAVNALISLGYRSVEARSTVVSVIESKGKNLSTEELIRYSLKALDKAT